MNGISNKTKGDIMMVTFAMTDNFSNIGHYTIGAPKLYPVEPLSFCYILSCFL
jgi:hypothetical protein